MGIISENVDTIMANNQGAVFLMVGSYIKPVE
jgi:hypothetical protein